MVAGARCVQVRGYLKTLGSRWDGIGAGESLMWVSVPVIRHYALYGAYEGDSMRGLRMSSVFPGVPREPAGCQPEPNFGWGDDIYMDVEYYRARETGLVWLRRAQRHCRGVDRKDPSCNPQCPRAGGTRAPT